MTNSRTLMIGTAVCLSVLVSFAIGRSLMTGARAAQVGQVLATEEAFRLAKLHNDVKALGALVAEEYQGLNQNGHSRDKAALLELFSTFRTRALTLSGLKVRILDDIAVVTGSQVEEVCNPDPVGFVRVYAHQRGRWRLLVSSQVREVKSSDLASRASL